MHAQCRMLKYAHSQREIETFKGYFLPVLQWGMELTPLNVYILFGRSLYSGRTHTMAQTKHMDFPSVSALVCPITREFFFLLNVSYTKLSLLPLPPYGKGIKQPPSLKNMLKEVSIAFFFTSWLPPGDSVC